MNEINWNLKEWGRAARLEQIRNNHHVFVYCTYTKQSVKKIFVPKKSLYYKKIGQSIEQGSLNPPPLLPPAAKTLFVKRVLDSQKLFIRGVLEGLIFFVPLCVPLWLKFDGESRED